MLLNFGSTRCFIDKGNVVQSSRVTAYLEVPFSFCRFSALRRAFRSWLVSLLCLRDFLSLWLPSSRPRVSCASRGIFNGDLEGPVPDNPSGVTFEGEECLLDFFCGDPFISATFWSWPGLVFFLLRSPPPESESVGYLNAVSSAFDSSDSVPIVSGAPFPLPTGRKRIFMCLGWGWGILGVWTASVASSDFPTECSLLLGRRISFWIW